MVGAQSSFAWPEQDIYLVVVVACELSRLTTDILALVGSARLEGLRIQGVQQKVAQIGSASVDVAERQRFLRMPGLVHADRVDACAMRQFSPVPIRERRRPYRRPKPERWIALGAWTGGAGDPFRSLVFQRPRHGRTESGYECP